MIPHPSTLRRTTTLCCAIMAMAIHGTVAMAQRPGPNDWTQHIRAGMQIGLNISAEFSQVGQFGVSQYNPGPAGVGGANHFYNDGYVLVDDTGNAGGFTSFWGYQNAGQYDAGANTLTFHSVQSFTQDDRNEVEGGPFPGFEMAYGWNVRKVLGGEFGWDLGVGILPIALENSRSLPTVASRTVHSFSTGSIVLPDAPYNGGSSGRGPTISDIATALPDDSISGTISGTQELDLILYSIRLGPTLQWQLAPRWSVQVSAGGAVGIVSGEYNVSETLQLADGSTALNIGSERSTEVSYGGYASAIAMWRAVEGGDIYAGAQFMALGNTKIAAGGREAELRLESGVYFIVGMNWPF